MEEYRYEENRKIADQVVQKLDDLKPGQLERVQKTIEQICREDRQAQMEKKGRWFKQAVVPVLKDFAENASANLTVDEQEEGAVIILSSPWGLVIGAGERLLRLVLLAASHMEAEAAENQLVLTLVYDWSAEEA